MAANIAEEIEHPEESEIGEPQFAMQRDSTGRIQAAAALTESPYDGNLYISYIATHPEMLGEGHGTALLNKIFKIAADSGVGVSLEATPQSEAFWRKMGAKPAEQMGPYGFEFPPEEVKARVEGKEPAADTKGAIDEHFKVPEGYAPFLQEMRDDQVRTVKSYQSGERPIAEYDNGKYRAAIMSGGRELLFKSGDETPVPSGLWQDYHDPDLNTYGVTEAEYKSLPFEKRAELNARVQADKYASKDYENLKHQFYNPKEAFGTGPGTGTKAEIAETPAEEIKHPKAPVDIRELKYPEADKDAKTAEQEAPAEAAGKTEAMQRLVDKLNAKDWWHVPPEQGPSAYAHRGKFMSSQVNDFYGAQLKEPQKVNITNPIVGTEPEIAEKLGLPTQYDGMPYEEMKKLDREWAVRAKELGHDAIVTVSREALDKFMAGGRIPRNMEIQDLTHLDDSLPTPKAQAHPDPIGVHEDDLPSRAKYANVDFEKPDLQDSAKRVTADSIRKDYVREKDRNKVSVYKSYIPMEDLPTPKFVDEQEENFDREDYRPRVGSPIKVDIHPNGSVNILDGNHRVQVWGEQNQQYAPAWVVDHRHPGIEMLSEDEKAEREEED